MPSVSLPSSKAACSGHIADEHRDAVGKRKDNDCEERTDDDDPKPLWFLGSLAAPTAYVQGQHDRKCCQHQTRNNDLVPAMEGPEHDIFITHKFQGVNLCP